MLSSTDAIEVGLYTYPFHLEHFSGMSIIRDPLSKVFSVVPVTNGNLYPVRKDTPCVEENVPSEHSFRGCCLATSQYLGLPFWGTFASIYPRPYFQILPAIGWRSCYRLPRYINAPSHPAVGWWRQLARSVGESLGPFKLSAADQNLIADFRPKTNSVHYETYIRSEQYNQVVTHRQPWRQRLKKSQLTHQVT